MADTKDQTFFPELPEDQRRMADLWLADYFRLVVRIHERARRSTDCPQAPIDDSDGTGTICTPPAAANHTCP